MRNDKSGSVDRMSAIFSRSVERRVEKMIHSYLVPKSMAMTIRVLIACWGCGGTSIRKADELVLVYLFVLL